MKKTGVVIVVEQDEVVIRAPRESSCGSCAGQSACGTLGSWDIKNKDKNDYEIRLPNTLHAKQGDVVTVEVPDQLILKASMMFYGYPVLAFLIMGAISFQAALSLGLSGDLFSAVGGLTAAGLTWLWLMKRPDMMQMPTMVEVERS
ncbi:MAG: SoxR reducing system RseC family protein [Ghiorsea sp.]|nr:SoxR reducing system RseC family protein [Ghiorsea sp.]